MEVKESKTIYFIYCQEGEKSNIQGIDKDDKIKEVKEISKDIYENSICILYCLGLMKNKEENKIKISLVDKQGIYYNATISLNSQELFGDKDYDTDCYTIYDVKFKPYNNNEGNYLNQKNLPHNQQFKIFENHLKNNDDNMIALYKTTIFQVFLQSIQKLEFIIDFFLKIYNTNKKIPKDIIQSFLGNMKFILRNCDFSKPVEKHQQKLEVLNNLSNIRSRLISLIKEVNLEENVDLFLAYYYIHYEKKLFIKYIYNDKYKDKINKTLTANRNLFNNFTCDVLTPELMDEAGSGLELLSLLQLFPNIVECFRIVHYKNIFFKFIYFKQWEKQGINLMLILSPKKTDNIFLLKEYFKKVYEHFCEEKIYPFLIKEDFFLKYYEVFMDDDDDFNKVIIIIEMLNLYNSKNSQKIRSEKIVDLFFKKGMSLLKNKKLKNRDFINFLKNIPESLKKDRELLENFHNGIDFEIEENNDKDLLNDILQEDKYNFKEYLDEYYYNTFQKIFNRFVLPKDLLALRKWKIEENTPLALIEIFLFTIERIWLKYPENNMFGLDNLFAKEFALASRRLKNFKKYLESIEEKIAKEKVMVIYSEILIKEYYIQEDFEKHIKSYIINYNKEITPRYIWFLMTTRRKDERIDMLRQYLEEEGKKYAVKYSDFAKYPNKVEERLILFSNLINYKIIPNYFRHTDYYKNSMESKFNIEQNTYKDSIVMLSNMEKIQELLESFFLENDEDKLTCCFLIMINFGDKVESAQKHFNSLKLIYNYWIKFFPKEKKKELIDLGKTIENFENKKLKDCAQETELEQFLLKSLKEAEKGKELEGSIFFMEFYERLNGINNEKERFEKSLSNFNKLEILGKTCNLKILENEIKEGIVDAVYKKKELLNGELNFIKNYFKFDEKSNYDIGIIRKDIIYLVLNKQKKLGSYKINVEEEPNLELEKIESRDKDVIKLKSEINVLSESFFDKSKTFDNEQEQDFELLSTSFSDFYRKLFTINMQIAKLQRSEIYNGIIVLSEKIYCSAKNLGILDNIKKKYIKGEFLLISEFIYILQIMRRYQRFEKNVFFGIFMVFNTFYENSQNNQISSDSINKLCSIIKDNIHNNNPNKFYIEFFSYEIERNKGKEMVKHILENKSPDLFDPSDLYEDLIPVIDVIFDREISEKLKFNNLGDDYFAFNSSEIIEISKVCDNEKISEMLLFYFENKIMMKMKLNEKEFFRKLLDIFKISLKFLEQDCKNNKEKFLSLLFSIAFVKCYLNKLINFVVSNSDPLENGDDLFNNILQFSYEKISPTITSIQAYVIKLFFYCLGNLYDFKKLDLNQFRMNDKNVKGKLNMDNNKNYGFDFLLIPIKGNLDDNQFMYIIQKLYQLKPTELPSESDISSSFNTNLDILFCIMVNFHFSLYYDSEYFKSDEYRDMNNWFEDVKVGVDFLRNNELIKKIFMYFMEIDNKKTVYRNYTLFNYDQLLSILISARFVLYTISSNNKKGMFYNILTNPKKSIDNNLDFFTEYYLKDLDINFTDKRKITCLTYKIYNFIILSHIYFGYVLNSISNDDIDSIFQLGNSDKNYIRDYLLDNLFKEFDFIKNVLLPLRGINKIIIFMNCLFKDLSPDFMDIKYDDNEEKIKEKEQTINFLINKIITNYRTSIDEYYKNGENISSSENSEKTETATGDSNNNTDYIDIILEKPSFYKNKNLDKKYPLLSYFTYTNFSVLKDDFRNQYIYYYNDSSNYPFISSYLSNEDNIFNIIKYIPKLNKFSNFVYDTLNMRYSKKETKTKKIKEIFNEELKEQIKEFNDFIDNNNKLFNTKNKIKEDSNLEEIINIPGSKINSIYTEIIKLYNAFIDKMMFGKYIKQISDNVIIQEARESDYNVNYVIRNENKKMTIKDKIDELVLLYSKRKRKDFGDLNVYTGSEIIYDFETIENKLEEQFIFGKKYFDEKQKIINFSDDIFEKEENTLLEFEKKFPQKKINEQEKKKFEEYLNNLSEGNSLNIFYEIISLINHLNQNEFNDKFIKDENSFNNIIKHFELKSYNFPELKKAKESLSNNLSLKSILYFFENIQNKAFIYLTPDVKEKINNEEFNLKENIKDQIEKILNGNKTIQKNILFTAFRKYVLRNVKNREIILFNFSDLIKNKNIWDMSIFGTSGFSEECNKLFEIEFNENIVKKCVVKYCYIQIYKIKFDDNGANTNIFDVNNNNNNDYDGGDDDDDDNKEKGLLD